MSPSRSRCESGPSFTRDVCSEHSRIDCANCHFWSKPHGEVVFVPCAESETLAEEGKPMPDRGEAERIGQAMLDLAARLPEGYHDIHGTQDGQAQLYVGYDAGDEVWEVEFCALDPARNFTMQDRSLDELMARAITRDREEAPNV
jgi:hypothetical protein